MAKGVAKTYDKLYRQNLGRALELLAEEENGEEVARRISDEAKAASEAMPKLDDGETYMEAELEILARAYGTSIARRLQNFAFARANRETDRCLLYTS